MSDDFRETFIGRRLEMQYSDPTVNKMLGSLRTEKQPLVYNDDIRPRPTLADEEVEKKEQFRQSLMRRFPAMKAMVEAAKQEMAASNGNSDQPTVVMTTKSKSKSRVNESHLLQHTASVSVPDFSLNLICVK